MLSHEAQNALIIWEAAGTKDHLCFVQTKKENIKLNIIQCYAPTNDKDEEINRTFTTNCRHCVTIKLKEKDMTILM